MNSRPSLALLIPAFNAAQYLPRLLASAARQTESFDEIWVYDDCSSDDTVAVAKRHGARVVRGDVNRGCSYGKNTLAAHTQADWLHFHDVDDLLLPNFVECAREWMRCETVDVVAFGCEERWEETGEVISLTCPDDAKLSADPVGYTISYKINAISGLYRRSAFLAAGGFDLDPDVLLNEDQALHAKLARAGLRFRGDRVVTVVNLRQPTSMWTANRDKAFRARYHVLKKSLSDRCCDRHRDALAEQLWQVASGAGSLLDWQTADRAAMLAMQLAGSSVAPSGQAFKVMCGVSPRLALRIREWLIRTLKPRYRDGHPGWRSPVNVV